MHAAVKRVLYKDMATAGEYLQTWKLKLSMTKMLSAAFHLNNKEAKHEVKVNYNNEIQPFCSEPKYLGVMLDRLLTYRQYLGSLCKKLTSRIMLLRRLAGSGWGAGTTTLQTATLALVHSTAEYCAPVWCRSAHTRLIDPDISNASQIVTGCLCPTPADNLSILASIQPAELCHKGATLSLACHAMEPGHLLHSVLICPLSANAWRLKSRHPFVPATHEFIISSDNNIHMRTLDRSLMECGMVGQPHKTPHFHPRHWHLPGITLLSTVWVQRNCHRTSVKCFFSYLYKWGMACSAACECGKEQTIDHVIFQYPIHIPPHGLHGLMVLDDETSEWLLNTCPNI